MHLLYLTSDDRFFTVKSNYCFMYNYISLLTQKHDRVVKLDGTYITEQAMILSHYNGIM